MLQHEKELVRQAIEGHQSAVIALYEMYKSAVFNYVYYRVGGNQALAEDLTAEVFLRMVSHIHTFVDRKRPLRAWLYTVARNLIHDHYRANGKVKWVALNEQEKDTRATPEQLASLGMESTRLVNAMPHLTELQRDVIILRFIEGLSVAETAAILKKNEGAVKSLTRRALAALRRVLEKESSYEPR